MDELLSILEGQPREILQWMILELMRKDKISFTELAEMHNKYLESLKRKELEELMHLRSEVIGLWCGTKKDIGKKLVKIIQQGKDNRWVNIEQEKIDNSKWNR